MKWRYFKIPLNPPLKKGEDFKTKTTIKTLQILIESENTFAGSATKNGMERINNFKESSIFNFTKLTTSKTRIKYENSCGAIPITIARTRMNSEKKIVLSGVDIN